ncbi:hypothetical protein HAX54_039343, partial [Datura stramonium]|nr:hypothetical protein [Datura stramonium]
EKLVDVDGRSIKREKDKKAMVDQKLGLELGVKSRIGVKSRVLSQCRDLESKVMIGDRDRGSGLTEES